MNYNLQPILKNDLLTLLPLHQDSFEALYKVASDPLIWQQHQNKERHTLEHFTHFFNEALESNGTLVILDRKSNDIIGSSRFKIIDDLAGIVEIGWTFLGRKYWGGQYNRECKKLMVNHALQSFNKVVFYVHPGNFRSQQAMRNLGADQMECGDVSWVLPKEKGLTFVIDKALV